MHVAIMYLCKREKLACRVRGWNAGTERRGLCYCGIPLLLQEGEIFCALVIPQGKLQKQGQSHL